MMKYKRMRVILLLIVMAMFFTTKAYAENVKTVIIKTNNNLTATNVSCFYDQNNILFLPAKDIAKALGGVFEYNVDEMSGRFKVGGNELVYRLDNRIACFNGKNVEATATLRIKDLRLMVPAFFTINKLGGVSYINNYRNVFLIYNELDKPIMYEVIKNDTLWIVSQTFNISISKIKSLNKIENDTIYVGQKLIIQENVTNVDSGIIVAYTSNNATIFSGEGFSYAAENYLKAWTSINIIGKNGDWYKAQTAKGNGYLYKSVVYIKQDVADNNADSTYFNEKIPIDTSKDYIIYSTYTVQRSDTLWYISEKYGIPDYELADANGISTSSMLNIGQVLKIPIHKIPVKDKANVQSGELLDWFSEAQYIFSIGKIGKFIDKETGKSFMAKRTMGASHADVETLTAQDSTIMKEVFGGKWVWERRSFILELDGRSFAISVAGMAHAGVDGVKFLQNVNNRSDNYGYGPNYDSIAGNNMDGHFDVFFLNCLRHKDNQVDPTHQSRVLISAGLE